MGIDGQMANEACGIIPRAMDDLFERLETMRDPEYVYLMTVSFLELYNEELLDLLTSNGKCGKMGTAGPAIRECQGKIVWSGVSERFVKSSEEVYR